jgi:hypothetical protein
MGERTGTVYVLTDPTNGLVRYVGSTLTPLRARLSGHLHAARDLGRPDATAPVAVWVRALLERGLRPTIIGLREAPEAALRAVERAEIERHYDEGWPLLNVRDSPGASYQLHPERKLAAARARVRRLAGVGGDLLAAAERDAATLETQMRELDAWRAELAVLDAARQPDDPGGYGEAIRLLLADWNREPGTQLPQADLDVLAGILLDLATVGHRHGVPFTHVVTGTGRALLRDMRAGVIARQPAAA